MIYSNSAERTTLLAKTLAQLLQKGDVITLEGDLGAGKTAFTKGLAQGLNIERNVNSPTFTIIKEYLDGRLPLYHMDVYRLENGVEELGFDEYFHGDGVTVIEWAHIIKEELPEERLQIEIYRKSENERELVFIPLGDRYKQMYKEFEEHECVGH
ncbi:tRNA (adenosine(37)-N6)-threonylcarbamoyltransferase complex ATPase subunit type 1 TsaE [Bacillus carboniphilus]|uniref:tRNA threonylcarbamoyladenosine biosynthesis protein TsaE n=1 Tax=Bacillus carboniphilus TaxID=86663 RepID=A0ABY9JYA2_9BACI|nr:tRNA (adenosine(37)-N6)-threonylcarbamoyltransferase complex ATPase subunit type 1 TsaE [Bacillus carboniphilus]WLR44359.1 tRNA (adenosine(37)-N6)-threonylcarbamoyltransferase complex ATPase subunit type 1 TsaE [Bacillus carboniphilus]